MRNTQSRILLAHNSNTTNDILIILKASIQHLYVPNAGWNLSDLLLHVEWGTDHHSEGGTPGSIQGHHPCHVPDCPADRTTVWILCPVEGDLARDYK